jgi:hypothetical protein
MSEYRHHDHKFAAKAAKEAVGIWNARRAAGADLWMYPTVAAAMTAGCPWLHFVCSSCQHSSAVDLRTFGQHRAASISSIIPEILCERCQRQGEVRLFRLSPDQSR